MRTASVAMTRPDSIPAAPPAPPSVPCPQHIPNWQFEDEYQEEAIQHMFALEAASAPSLSMIDAQPEIGWDMRTYLVDFLIEVHQSYRMPSESVLYQTVNIVDRYMSKRVVLKKHYQLLACCSLMLACRYDSAQAPTPTVRDCRALCRYAFERPAFIQMMSHILATLDWRLGLPCIHDTLAFKCAALQDSPEVVAVAQYLAQLTLYSRAFVGVPSAAVAAACHTLARTIYDPQAEPGVHMLHGPAAKAGQTLQQLLCDRTAESLPVLNKKHQFAAALVQRYLTTHLMHSGHELLSLRLGLPATPIPASGEVDCLSTPSTRQSSVSSVYLPQCYPASDSGGESNASSPPSTPADTVMKSPPASAHETCQSDYPWPVLSPS